MPRILIAEDQWLARLGIEEMIKGLGYEVVGQAESGRQAVDMARQLKPDLILMDVVMPGEMDGIDAAVMIKAELDIPIVFISGYGDSEYIERAKTIEPFGYLMKPFDGNEVRAFIEIALHKREIELKLRKAHERLKQTNQELKREIRERKETEKALRKSEERYRRLVKDAPAGILEFDLNDQKMSSVNDLVCIYSGYSREELINMNALELLAEESRTRCLERLKKLAEGETVPDTVEYEFIRKDGQRFWVLLNEGFHFENGMPVSVTIVLHDITGRIAFEAQIRESYKMKAVSTLAGGIAHQFNNALSPIIGNIDLLEMKGIQDEEMTMILKQMKASGLHMAHLTRQLLAYAMQGKYNAKPISLTGFVSETIPLIEHSLHPGIRLETDLPTDISPIKADPTQLQMALSALITNANEAMEGRGRIRISVQNMDLEPGFVADHPGLEPGPHVCLSIEDDGKGMDEETRKKIFDPFFTTHFLGRGLGMAAVYGIVKNHDGAIEVTSEPGTGTVVRIYLPVSELNEPSKKILKEE